MGKLKSTKGLKPNRKPKKKPAAKKRPLVKKTSKKKKKSGSLVKRSGSGRADGVLPAMRKRVKNFYDANRNTIHTVGKVGAGLGATIAALGGLYHLARRTHDHDTNAPNSLKDLPRDFYDPLPSEKVLREMYQQYFYGAQRDYARDPNAEEPKTYKQWEANYWKAMGSPEHWKSGNASGKGLLAAARARLGRFYHDNRDKIHLAGKVAAGVAALGGLTALAYNLADDDTKQRVHGVYDNPEKLYHYGKYRLRHTVKNAMRKPEDRVPLDSYGKWEDLHWSKYVRQPGEPIPGERIPDAPPPDGELPEEISDGDDDMVDASDGGAPEAIEQNPVVYDDQKWDDLYDATGETEEERLTLNAWIKRMEDLNEADYRAGRPMGQIPPRPELRAELRAEIQRRMGTGQASGSGFLRDARHRLGKFYHDHRDKIDTAGKVALGALGAVGLYHALDGNLVDNLSKDAERLGEWWNGPAPPLPPPVVGPIRSRVVTRTPRHDSRMDTLDDLYRPRVVTDRSFRYYRE